MQIISAPHKTDHWLLRVEKNIILSVNVVFQHLCNPPRIFILTLIKSSLQQLMWAYYTFPESSQSGLLENMYIRPLSQFGVSWG